MEEKINYHKIALQTLEKIAKREKKPRLLLHACCGPCAVYPIVFLSTYFEITIMYNNNNIYPKEEYDRRYLELLKVQEKLENEFEIRINVFKTTYENNLFNQDLNPYGLEMEGGKRCFICFAKRIEEGLKYASDNGFDFYTTVMTISRQKNSQVINQIGEKLQHKYPNVTYLFSDFKKDNGLLKARDFKIRYNLYQQLYCGCKYSFEMTQKKIESNDNDE